MRSTVSWYLIVEKKKKYFGKVILYSETLEEMGIFNSYCFNFFYDFLSVINCEYKMLRKFYWEEYID